MPLTSGPSYIALSPAITQGGTKNLYCLRGRQIGLRTLQEPCLEVAAWAHKGLSHHLLYTFIECLCCATVGGHCHQTEAQGFTRPKPDPGILRQVPRKAESCAVGRETMARGQPSQRPFLIRQPWQLTGRFGSGVRMCSQDFIDLQEAAQH